MTDLARTWVVIPAYNEAGNDTIGSTVRGIRGAFPNVVVVDDCSRDDTGPQARAAGAHLLRHPVNLGQGAALATGIRYALTEGAYEIVTFDADGQHRVEDALAMVEMRRRAGVDVVLGSRFLGSAEGIPPLRRRVIRLAASISRLTTGLSVTDTHNGLRVLSRHAAETIVIRQNRMAHASEFLSQIAAHRLSHVEAPTRIVYTEYSLTKGQKLTGAFAILKDLAIRRLYR
jgi:polyprenyl-phospho-N-acetylgalactosaminyl synthase